ncbi:uncharacterized protein EI90DRAFT_3056512 [Cantharellus anzutake]|uniref:uncharacterized protein n=1 Tax=Cantharellus anzutake TaxID=1750568 RepID=UPI00190392EF|nr:uncharacterized protein EI90DRAFT_3056512 [Cantharellus anzutake]KAF8332087.1 hypothetical protein EI90DRAFT_3056512 [Cantharellus anzutake]
MSMLRLVSAALLFAHSLFMTANGQDMWCGKPYQKGSPPVTIPPESMFPVPPTSSLPLLDFSCNPAVQPYISGEDELATFLLDAEITSTVGQPFSGIVGETSLQVELVHGQSIFATAVIEAGRRGVEVNVPLATYFAPSSQGYQIQCVAKVQGASTYNSSTVLKYLPPNQNGSVIKLDLRTGTLLTKPKGSTEYQPIVPYGFYTSFSDYLALNLSVVNEIKAQGFNVIHPIPPFGSNELRDAVFDRMEEVGMYLIYDMRNDYQNLTAVREQVESVKGRANLLLWYTADEPDGWGFPHNSTTIASGLIRSIDPYHPISLVLNCYDYYFKEYVGDAEIVLQDTYPIGINATHSIVWDTNCTSTYGDCGCDDCLPGAGLRDIARRQDVFLERAQLMGRRRSLTVWDVPQGFGEETYWPRYPTGKEFVAEVAISLLHGATGVTSWNMPTTAEITSAASQLALEAWPQITQFVSDKISVFTLTKSDGDTVEAGLWYTANTSRSSALLIIVNVGEMEDSVSLALPYAADGGWNKIFQSGSTATLSASQTNSNATATVDGFGVAVFVHDEKRDGMPLLVD